MSLATLSEVAVHRLRDKFMAGKTSLANALAVTTSLVVLLGDSRQLARPSSGDHPAGAGVWAMEHLSVGAEATPPGKGIFLDTTYRKHPDIFGY